MIDLAGHPSARRAPPDRLGALGVLGAVVERALGEQDVGGGARPACRRRPRSPSGPEGELDALGLLLGASLAGADVRVDGVRRHRRLRQHGAASAPRRRPAGPRSRIDLSYVPKPRSDGASASERDGSETRREMQTSTFLVPGRFRIPLAFGNTAVTIHAPGPSRCGERRPAGGNDARPGARPPLDCSTVPCLRLGGGRPLARCSGRRGHRARGGPGRRAGRLAQLPLRLRERGPARQGRSSCASAARPPATINSIELTDDGQAEMTVTVDERLRAAARGHDGDDPRRGADRHRQPLRRRQPGAELPAGARRRRRHRADKTTPIVELDQLFNTLDRQDAQGLEQLHRRLRRLVRGQGARGQRVGEVPSPALARRGHRSSSELNRDSRAFDELPRRDREGAGRARRAQRAS